MWEKIILVCNTIAGSQDNAVGISTDYRRDGKVVGARTVSSLHCSSWLWGPHISLSNVTDFPSLRIKWLGHKADQSPPTTAKAKKMWIYISSPYLNGTVFKWLSIGTTFF
jgi:hypothetical protein